MASITESCSVCGSPFEPQFRYQMEEIRGGFAFYCSQACLERSQRASAEGSATCDACGKAFQVELVSSVFYLGGKRRYACSLGCRTQLTREASGARLGEIAAIQTSTAVTSSTEHEKTLPRRPEPVATPPV